MLGLSSDLVQEQDRFTQKIWPPAISLWRLLSTVALKVLKGILSGSWDAEAILVFPIPGGPENHRDRRLASPCDG